MFGFHYRLERKAIGLALGIVGVASIGGIVEIAPLFTIHQTVEDAPDMRLYTPLELAGRNIYIREGCYACHSQMIRTLRDEVDRYGPYSLAVESKYDHPMLWGSKRTGKATNVRPFDGLPNELTEMDAVVAYLQVLGHLTDAAAKPVAQAGGGK